MAKRDRADYMRDYRAKRGVENVTAPQVFEAAVLENPRPKSTLQDAIRRLSSGQQQHLLARLEMVWKNKTTEEIHAKLGTAEEGLRKAR